MTPVAENVAAIKEELDNAVYRDYYDFRCENCWLWSTLGERTDGGADVNMLASAYEKKITVAQ